MNIEVAFERWCDELDKIAREKYEFKCDCTKTTGRECWRGYFDAGESPEAALLEDLSNA